jgi:hypothetical protein
MSNIYLPRMTSGPRQAVGGTFNFGKPVEPAKSTNPFQTTGSLANPGTNPFGGYVSPGGSHVDTLGPITPEQQQADQTQMQQQAQQRADASEQQRRNAESAQENRYRSYLNGEMGSGEQQVIADRNAFLGALRARAASGTGNLMSRQRNASFGAERATDQYGMQQQAAHYDFQLEAANSLMQMLNARFTQAQASGDQQAQNEAAMAQMQLQSEAARIQQQSELQMGRLNTFGNVLDDMYASKTNKLGYNIGDIYEQPDANVAITKRQRG